MTESADLCSFSEGLEGGHSSSVHMVLTDQSLITTLCIYTSTVLSILSFFYYSSTFASLLLSLEIFLGGIANSRDGTLIGDEDVERAVSPLSQARQIWRWASDQAASFHTYTQNDRGFWLKGPIHDQNRNIVHVVH